MCPILSFSSDLYQRKDSYSVLFHYRVQSLPYSLSVEAGEGKLKKLKSDTHSGRVLIVQLSTSDSLVI